jgi:hypothetical protein
MATTTPNYGWPVPTSTDLVKNGATAIEALGDAIDASLLDLKGGTTGQVLSKTTNTDMDFTWIANDVGDITGVTASTPLTGGGTSGAVTVGILDATTSNKGAVQLSTSTSSTSTTLAATASAVKDAYDLANTANTNSNNITMVQQYTATESVLKNISSRIPAAEQLLKQAVYWIDAAQSDNSDQVLDNQGWGAPSLTTQLGSSASADSNDPKFLDFVGTNYAYMPGVVSNYLSVPDATNLRITGDFDIRVQVSLDNWTPANNNYLLSKSGGNSTWSYALRVTNTTGVLTLVLSTDGSTTSTASSSVGTGLSAGATKWVRATRNAAGGIVKFFLSDNGVTWTQLGTDVTGVTTGNLFGAATVVEIGSVFVGTTQPMTGNVYRAQIYSDITETTKVLDVDTSIIGSGSATSFNALTGQTVTINRSTSGKKTAVVTAPLWLLGTDDYMEVADNALLDFNATDSFTMLAVIRQWATPSSGRVINKSANSGTFDGYLLRNSGTSSAEEAYLTSSVSGSAGPITSPAYTLGQPFVTGLVVNRSTQVANTIMNTSLSSNTSISSVGTLETTYPLRIGNVSTGSNQYGDFELMAAAIFRRVLTSTEIATVYNYYTARIGA